MPPKVREIPKRPNILVISHLQFRSGSIEGPAARAQLPKAIRGGSQADLKLQSRGFISVDLRALNHISGSSNLELSRDIAQRVAANRISFINVPNATVFRLCSLGDGASHPKCQGRRPSEPRR